LLIVAILWWDRRRNGAKQGANKNSTPGMEPEPTRAEHGRASPPAREARRPLPVIEFSDDVFAGGVAEAAPDRLEIGGAGGRLAGDGDGQSVDSQHPEQKRSGVSIMRGHAVDVPGSARTVPTNLAADATTIVEAEPGVGQAFDAHPQGDRPPQDVTTNGHPPKMVLDWPPEKERRLVSVRLVARRYDSAGSAEGEAPRFAGHLLRQALAGEGFWHGKFDIFHLPLPDGRVVLSAAGLTQPGTFDLATMDAQRFVGLSIFAVLPGPLPDSVTFEEIVAVSRQLAERLGADLQDSRGTPLTHARVTDLRATFVATDAAASAGGER